MDGSAQDVAIRVGGLGKSYRIYDRPQDRLKQAMFRGRRQYFREFWAVRDVSLQIQRGETVGIVGRNGCGKSTLLQMICGTLRATTGTVEVQGRIAALLELGAGFNPEFSGRDNVFTNAAILGLTQEQIRERFEQIVDFAELWDFIDQPVKTYSSGMFVRLAFAVAISVDPDILVVDEALAVGDEAFQRKCFARIQEIQRRGGTILFVSHAADSVVQLCNRAVLLDQGALLMQGEPRAVVAQYHKLLYAPAQKAAEIRRAITEGGVPPSDDQTAAAAAAVAVAEENSRAYYDPHMQSKSLVAYERIGAEVVEPQITTPGGRRVNVLASHEEYVVRYRVVFSQPAYHVRFGTLIKNLLGTEISGVTQPHSSQPACDCFPAGAVIDLAFRFRCQLMPGAYFANVGLMGVVNGQLQYLHRLVDVLMFRVQEGEVRSTSGVADIFLESEQETLVRERQAAA